MFAASFLPTSPPSRSHASMTSWCYTLASGSQQLEHTSHNIRRRQPSALSPPVRSALGTARVDGYTLPSWALLSQRRSARYMSTREWTWHDQRLGTFSELETYRRPLCLLLTCISGCSIMIRLPSRALITFFTKTSIVAHFDVADSDRRIFDRDFLTR